MATVADGLRLVKGKGATRQSTGGDDGAILRDLLDAVETILSSYVVFRTREQRTAVALWIAHAHALDAFDVTPYLHVKSAEKRSGKTRLLEVINELVPRPEFTGRLSEAAMFRLIQAEGGPPTLLVDEVDAIFKGPPTERTEGVRALLNSGYKRGVTIPRCVGQGNTLRVHRFPTFCAKALSGIGSSLPDTVIDRSIPIAVARRKKSEPVAKFRLRVVTAEATPIREGLAAWAEAATDALRAARPDVPDLDNDRAEEVWEPLLAIADAAGGEWPSKARAAAFALHDAPEDTDSVNVLLLRAIREVFEQAGSDRILTTDLLRALIDREGEPWGGWWGKDVDAAKDGETPRKPAMDLARHLRPFEVQPREIRVPDGRKAKGYLRGDFADAFDRFLPPKRPGGRDVATSVEPQGFEASRPPSAEHQVATPESVGAQGLS
jgi:Protein of unknown function (DUF3631)